jgi:dTDP-glucose 4,6-dehydratase
VKTVLLTGSAGFIGSHVLDALLEDNTVDEIISIDALTYAANTQYIAEKAHCAKHIFYDVDIRNSKAISKIFESHQIHLIIHLAAESHVDRSIDGATDFLTTNILGTQVLLDCLRMYSPRAWFIYLSTDEVYGPRPIESPARENAHLVPTNPYSVSKAAADMLVSAYQNTFGINATIIRLCNNYGPRQHLEKFIPKMITNCMNDEKLPVYGTGNQMREWLYVEDTVKALLLIIHHKLMGKTFNLGSGNHYENVDVIKMILVNICDSKSTVDYVGDRLGHDFSYALDSQTIRDTVGWRPQISFEEGLARTIDYYKSKKYEGDAY